MCRFQHIMCRQLSQCTYQVALSDTMDNWIARQHTLLQVAQAHQHQSDSHLLVEYDPGITEYPGYSNCYPNIADHSK